MFSETNLHQLSDYCVIWNGTWRVKTLELHLVSMINISPVVPSMLAFSANRPCAYTQHPDDLHLPSQLMNRLCRWIYSELVGVAGSEHVFLAFPTLWQATVYPTLQQESLLCCILRKRIHRLPIRRRLPRSDAISLWQPASAVPGVGGANLLEQMHQFHCFWPLLCETEVLSVCSKKKEKKITHLHVTCEAHTTESRHTPPWQHTFTPSHTHTHTHCWDSCILLIGKKGSGVQMYI